MVFMSTSIFTLSTLWSSVITIREYAKEMQAFEDNKEYRLEMSANARKKYDNHYKYDTVINKIIDVYYEVKASIARNE